MKFVYNKSELIISSTLLKLFFFCFFLRYIHTNLQENCFCVREAICCYENDGNMIKRMFALDILVSLSLAHRCVTSLSTWPETVALHSPHGEEQPKKELKKIIL